MLAQIDASSAPANAAKSVVGDTGIFDRQALGSMPDHVVEFGSRPLNLAILSGSSRRLGPADRDTRVGRRTLGVGGYIADAHRSAFRGKSVGRMTASCVTQTAVHGRTRPAAATADCDWLNPARGPVVLLRSRRTASVSSAELACRVPI